MSKPLQKLERLHISEGVPESTIDRFVEIIDALNLAIERINELAEHTDELRMRLATAETMIAGLVRALHELEARYEAHTPDWNC